MPHAEKRIASGSGGRIPEKQLPLAADLQYHGLMFGPRDVFMRSFLAVVLILSLALPVLAKKPVRKPGEARQFSDTELATMEKAAFEGVNAERSRQGLLPLSWNENVATVAREHSMNMASSGFFAHNDPQGRTPGDRATSAGISFTRFGENIIKVDSPRETAAALARTAVKGWMGSPKHRANILQGDFRESGMGVVQGADRRVYFTQNFLQGGAQLEPPPSRRGDAASIAGLVEQGLRAIHASGQRPANGRALADQLAYTLRNRQLARGISIHDRNSGARYAIDLIVDGCVLVSIVPNQSAFQARTRELAPLVRGRATYQALIVCCHSPIAWARIDEQSGTGPGAGASGIPTTGSGKVDGRKILRDLLKKL